VDLFLEAHQQAPDRIVLDVDANDLLHGKQKGRFYHGYYKDYCYLPLYVLCGEHLLCSRLRRSNIDASADSVEELEPLVARMRQRWPAVKIWLRVAPAFCREKLMAWCERGGSITYLGWSRIRPPGSRRPLRPALTDFFEIHSRPGILSSHCPTTTAMWGFIDES
jgi:hypothetical protein